MTKAEKCEASRKYYALNIKERREYGRKYRELHRAERREYDRTYRQLHLQEIREKSRKYQQLHGEDRKEYLRNYGKINREKIRIQHLEKKEHYNQLARSWRSKHKEYVREYRKKYQKSPKGKAVISRMNAKRRSSLLGTLITIKLTDKEWETLKLAYDYRCVYCGRKRKLTQDHIMPLLSGGHHIMENVVPACRSCNSSKGSKNLRDAKKSIQLMLL